MTTRAPTHTSAQSASAQRDPRGRFSSARNPEEYYAIIRDGALLAAARTNPTKEPHRVSQNEWNAVKVGLLEKYGPPIPDAHSICDRLRNAEGNSFPWRDLLKVALSNGDIHHIHEHRLRGERVPATVPQARTALVFVARYLDKASLTQDGYALGRERAITDHGEAARTRLPTVGQILVCCGFNWDTALELAGLKPRSGKTTPAAAVSIVDASVFYYSQRGCLPASYSTLAQFARDRTFALHGPKRHDWSDAMSRSTEQIAALGFEPPPPDGEPPPEWTPLPWAPALPVRNQQRWDLLGILEAVAEFKAWLENAAATHAKYKIFHAERPGTPPLNSVLRRGTLRALLKFVAQPDWRERAGDIDAELAAQRQKEPRSSRRNARHRGTANRTTAAGISTRIEMMRFLSQNGASPAVKIAEAVGVSRMSVWKVMKGLDARGYVRRTESSAHSDKQRYVLTEQGIAGLADEMVLRAALRVPADGVEAFAS